MGSMLWTVRHAHGRRGPRRDESLSSVSLPSARRVTRFGFAQCRPPEIVIRYAAKTIARESA